MWQRLGQVRPNCVPQRRGEGAVDLDSGHVGARFEEGEGEGPEAGPDLQHEVPGLDSGGADDAADGAGVVHEVLPERLGGTDPEIAGKMADLRRSEEGHGSKPRPWPESSRRWRSESSAV